MTVKMRRVGTSNVLTVPKSVKEIHKEYEVYPGRGGAMFISSLKICSLTSSLLKPLV